MTVSCSSFPADVSGRILERDADCFLRGVLSPGPDRACEGPGECHRRLSGKPATVPNGVGLCRKHHEWAHRFHRRSRRLGLTLRKYADPEALGFDPAAIPVRKRPGPDSKPYWLTGDGQYAFRPPPERRRCMGSDTRCPDPEIREHYAVTNELWDTAVPTEHGLLCIGCLERRIGRRLTPADFADCLLNEPPWVFNRDARALDRMGIRQTEDGAWERWDGHAWMQMEVRR
jgi:hypothetical protein